MARRTGRVRRRRLVVALSTLLTLSLVGSLVWLFAFSSALAAQQTRVEGLDEADTATVLAAAAVPTGVPLARVDTGAVARRVEQVPFVRSVTVSRGWPHTVVLTVAPRVAVLVTRGPSGALTLVDETGLSFRDVGAAPEGLPLVERAADQAGTPDQSGDAGLRAVIEMLGAFGPGRRAQVSDIHLSAGQRVSFRLGTVEVAWGGGGLAARKVAVIDALLPTKPSAVDVSVPDSPVTR